MLNILITGVGGQGTVLTARLLGLAALYQGLDVRGSETIGMAQRGGSVAGHVRMGKDIASPLIPPGQADLILAFEPGEALRAAGFLSRNGVMLASNRPVSANYNFADVQNWLNSHIPAMHWIDGGRVIAATGARSLNIALIGAAIRLGGFRGAINLDVMEKAIKARLPERFWELNIRALYCGGEQAVL